MRTQLFSPKVWFLALLLLVCGLGLTLSIVGPRRILASVNAAVEGRKAEVKKTEIKRTEDKLSEGGPAEIAAAVPANAKTQAPAAQTGLPPVLISSTPAAGARWDGGPVTLLFDQPMTDNSGQSLTITPPLAGDVSVAGAALAFTPTEAPTPGVRYRFTMGAEAQSAAGVEVGNPIEIILVAASPLQVSSTQPSDGNSEVSTDSQIVIVFNRPVVALVGVDDQSSLPQPLTLEPVVEGKGEWRNTSIYVFRPALGLAGATTYQVTVDNIADLDGATLAAPYSFSFTTAAPIVTDAQPAGDQARPDGAIVVTFSQPMDPASSEAAFSLSKTVAGVDPLPVEGVLAWNETNTTLTFTPTQWLEFGAPYTVVVETDAQPASQQGNLRERFEQSFSVVPLPAVANTSPLNDADHVVPDNTVTIQFNTPLSRTTVLPNIRMTPTLTTTVVYSYYREYDNTVELTWVKEAQTRYTVTVGSAIEDNYGNKLGQDYVFSFTTGDHSPFVRANLDQFTHFSAYTETRVSILYRNMESVDVALYRIPLPELLKLTGNNQWEIWQNYKVPDADANRVWARSYAPRGGPNITARQVISLTDEAGNRLPPGAYLLEVAPPPNSSTPDSPAQPNRALIVLSNDNLVFKKSSQGQSLAWMTDLQTGQPVAEQNLRFYFNNQVQAETSTDADGVATGAMNLDPNNSWGPALVIAGEPGDPNFAVASSEWSNGIASWDFGINGGYSPDQYQSTFYTDRPIYRPGQTIYWKGLVRVLTNDELQLPPADLPVEITVRDDRGNAILTEKQTLGEHGTLHGQVILAPEAVTGYYYIEARLQVGPEQTVYGGVGFQVAAYRKPEFEISVTPDKPEYVQGDTVRVTVQANYFSGGPLANAPITWRLLAEPYYFSWKQQPADRYFSFTPFDPNQTDYDPYQGVFNGLLEEKTGTTGADGSFVIELPADIGESIQSQNWTFDVTIQSPTNQFVSGRTNAPIHKGNYYIGISPQSYVAQTGQENKVDLVTVTPQGEPYPGAELEVVVSEFKWNSVYEQMADGSYAWKTSVERTPVYTTSITSNRDGAALLTWTPTKGGQYQIAASGADEAGNQIRSAEFVWVSSGDFIAWPRDNNDRIKLVADKQKYAPGETAKILIPSPFAGTVKTLVTIERSGVIESSVIDLKGNSETLEVPITAEHIPNIFVSVILIKGIDETNPLAAMRIGYVQLNVDTSQKALSVDVAPSASVVKPGDAVTYTLTVKDSSGEPVPNAEISVALVDKAVLSLVQGDTRTLIDIFYYQRPLGVTTGASLVINRDRLSQQLSEGAKGGGGGGPGSGLEIREDFPDVAFWRADFLSDEQGMITFTVTLPDNLTTWRLAAKAITDETLVGEAVNDIVATKALQVRPLLPRFFTAGDRAKIGAVVLNTGAEVVNDLQFEITISGATLETDKTSFTTDLEASGQASFDFPITVNATAENVVVTFTAQSPTLSDGVRMTLPVRRYETPEVVATSGTVPPEGRLEAIRLPEAATENGELLVTLEPSLAAGMLDGLTYLRHYPYECNEQLVSRFLPNLFTVRALRNLNIEHSALEKALNYQLGIAVQRLVSRQNADGGWGYWPTEESSPFITSYVLWGLYNAQAMDYMVPELALTNGATYLEGQFQAPKDVTDNWRLNQMAFMNFVLAEMGRGDPGRASTLYDERERLALYGKAYLAMALAKLTTKDNEQVQSLLDDLFGNAEITATGASWHEAENDWWTMNSDTRSTAIILAAFARLEPDEPLLPQVVRWLMGARKGGRWATTQENAWSIIALTDWMEATGELEANYEWTATLNGVELGKGIFSSQNISEKVELRAAVADLLRDESNALLMNRSNDSGQLYYTTHLRYYVDALAIEGRDRGIVVDRSFALDGKQVNAAKVGDVISVTVTIVAPTDLYHTLIEVPIPAGVEIIDPRLATTSQVFDEAGQPILTRSDTPWFFWTPTHTDIRDDRVALFATHLPAGTYEYSFQVRAGVPGEYRVLPVYAEMMYFNEVWGRSAGALFTVKE